MTDSARPPCVLAIAGSDSGGGAGIQADIKAFARCGVHGMTAVTAITAQSTVAVAAVEPVSPDTIVAQVEAVAGDIGVDAVKIGMLGSVPAVEAVARALDLVGDAPVVLDPVMVAESGASLIEDDAKQALIQRLVPHATAVTPNVAEARVLADGGRHTDPAAIAEPAGLDEASELARMVHALGPEFVVVTGGHAVAPVDTFFDGERLERLEAGREPAGATHGSGCTHSSALAAQLALGHEPLEAARCAKEIAAEAVRYGLSAIGRGSGPVNALGPVIPFGIPPPPDRQTALT